MSSRRVAVYPGSFDPIHNGHLDIVERCRTLFDELVVAVLHNEEKRALFSVEDRVAMLREQLAAERLREAPGSTAARSAAARQAENCRVESFSGLLVDFMDRVDGRIIVRGLRAISDFEYEFQMALMNRRLNPRVETVFLMPGEDYTYLSSRLVKEVFFLGGDLSGLVPEPVLRRLAEKRRQRQGGG
ncbi:MAG: pantetheine-phosphate adenylyltransferase [Thermoanaerobaculia bacterium]